MLHLGAIRCLDKQVPAVEGSEAKVDERRPLQVPFCHVFIWCAAAGGLDYFAFLQADSHNGPAFCGQRNQFCVGMNVHQHDHQFIAAAAG